MESYIIGPHLKVGLEWRKWKDFRLRTKTDLSKCAFSGDWSVPMQIWLVGEKTLILEVCCPIDKETGALLLRRELLRKKYNEEEALNLLSTLADLVLSFHHSNQVFASWLLCGSDV
jgi:hypothetical protein